MVAKNGVANEPWHLSLLNVAVQYEGLIEKTKVYDFLAIQNIELKDVVLNNFDEIFERFVCC
jgi:hypothetical protein